MGHRGRPLIALAVAAASGVLWGLAFASDPSPVLGWVALVPFLAALPAAGAARSARRAALLGLVQGMAAWLVSLPWIPPTLVTFGAIPVGLSWCLLALLAAYLSLYTVVFAVAARLFLARGGWALAALPAVWVALEWLRGFLFGGFPWNLAAYAWTDVPGALLLSAWVGPWGVSYLVVLANVGLAAAWRRRRADPALAALLAAALLLVLGGRFGRGEEDVPGGSVLDLPAVASPGAEVRIVQPNQDLRADAATSQQQYAAIVAQSQAACDVPSALLLWPESAAWPHTWQGSWQLRDDLLRLAARGCPTVFNTPTVDDEAEDVYFNSVFLVGAAGPEGRYDKRKLVPWGEYVPLADLLPFVGKLARQAGSFSAGRSLSLIDWRRERLGLAICYEVVFPGVIAEEVGAGATLLVNLSNDAWYGDSSAPRQLFRAARFRAAENRRVMLRAALTGISGVIDGRGEVLARLDLGERGVLRYRARGARTLTPYARAPWLVPAAAALVALFAIVSLAIAARRRGRGDLAAPSVPRPDPTTTEKEETP